MKKANEDLYQKKKGQRGGKEVLLFIKRNQIQDETKTKNQGMDN